MRNGRSHGDVHVAAVLAGELPRGPAPGTAILQLLTQPIPVAELIPVALSDAILAGSIADLITIPVTGLIAITVGNTVLSCAVTCLVTIPVAGLIPITVGNAVLAGPIAQLEAIPITGLIAITVADAVLAGPIAQLEAVALLDLLHRARCDVVRLTESALGLLHDLLGDTLGRSVRCVVTLIPHGGSWDGHSECRYGTQCHDLEPLSHDSSFSRPAHLETPGSERIRRSPRIVRQKRTPGWRRNRSSTESLHERAAFRDRSGGVKPEHPIHVILDPIPIDRCVEHERPEEDRSSEVDRHRIGIDG